MSELSPSMRAVGDSVIDAVRGYVSRALAPLLARLDQHARRAETSDAVLADLDARIEAAERRLAALEQRQ